jgi:hypothetical protein
LTFKQSAKDVTKGVLVALIGIGFFFLAGYIYSETQHEIGTLTTMAIGLFMVMGGFKIAKGPKEVRIVK